VAANNSNPSHILFERDSPPAECELPQVCTRDNSTGSGGQFAEKGESGRPERIIVVGDSHQRSIAHVLRPRELTGDHLQ